MATKNTIPTDQDMKQDIFEAREALRLVRVAVADGTANAAQLADAEQGLRFAETRLEAAEEARQERRHQADRKRAAEIAEELGDLTPLVVKQREREAAIRALVAEYLDTSVELRGEVANAYWELHTMRGHNPKGFLAEFGFRITSATTAIRFGDITFGASDGTQLLSNLELEASNRGGRLTASPAPAKRPERTKAAA